MTVVERFLKLVSYPTTSDEASETCPSTARQLALAQELVRQMQDMGIADAHVDKDGYVYGTVPANCEKDIPVYGLIAHMDTSPDAPGENIRARITEPYDGGDVVLPKEGFDTTVYNDVPVLMVNGDREFSTFCKSSPPFNTPSVAELMKDEVLLPQYRFAEKYGSLMYGYFNGEESAERMLGSGYESPIYTCIIRWGDDPAVVGEEYATIYGSYHCMTTPLMTHVLTNASSSYPELYASPSCQAVSSMLNTYYKNFLWSGNPNGGELPQWDAWTSLDGTTQLIVDANDDGAWAEMSTDHISYAEIIERMEADHSIPDDQKTEMIRTVLNGRWFSGEMDAYYGNEDLWA